ncbi:MAG: hypothetical protein ACK4PR_04295 [Gammaproteobacteria bacterium]
MKKTHSNKKNEAVYKLSAQKPELGNSIDITVLHKEKFNEYSNKRDLLNSIIFANRKKLAGETLEEDEKNIINGREAEEIKNKEDELLQQMYNLMLHLKNNKQVVASYYGCLFYVTALRFEIDDLSKVLNDARVEGVFFECLVTFLLDAAKLLKDHKIISADVKKVIFKKLHQFMAKEKIMNDKEQLSEWFTIADALGMGALFSQAYRERCTKGTKLSSATVHKVIQQNGKTVDHGENGKNEVSSTSLNMVTEKRGRVDADNNKINKERCINGVSSLSAIVHSEVQQNGKTVGHGENRKNEVPLSSLSMFTEKQERVAEDRDGNSRNKKQTIDEQIACDVLNRLFGAENEVSKTTIFCGKK